MDIAILLSFIILNIIISCINLTKIICIHYILKFPIVSSKIVFSTDSPGYLFDLVSYKRDFIFTLSAEYIGNHILSFKSIHYDDLCNYILDRCNNKYTEYSKEVNDLLNQIYEEELLDILARLPWFYRIKVKGLREELKTWQ